MLTLVAAVGTNDVIGITDPAKGAVTLPWNIPEDMAFFKTLTQGGVVIMGSKTYKSIPERFRPLKGRHNIVLTRGTLDGVETISDLTSEIVMRIQQEHPDKILYLIGGGQVYDLALQRNLVSDAYITHVDYDVPTSWCDYVFPTEKFQSRAKCVASREMSVTPIKSTLRRYSLSTES